MHLTPYSSHHDQVCIQPYNYYYTDLDSQKYVREFADLCLA